MIQRMLPLWGTMLVLLGAGLAPGIYKVQVKQTVLRATPSPFGKALTTLNFNTPLRVQSTSGSFAQVNWQGKQGYVFSSALLAQKKFNKSYTKIGKSADYSPSMATAAAKGFRESEDKYGKQGDKLDWKKVDQAAQLPTSPDAERWAAFRKQGGLGKARRTIPNTLHNKSGGR